MEYKELQVLYEDIAEKLIQNYSTHLNATTHFYPIIKESCRQFAKDLNLNLDELNELSSFIDDLFSDFVVTPDYNLYTDLFIDHCKYKMKSSDLPSIKKILKQLEIREKIEQINSDFN